VADEIGENARAKMASPCPDIEAEHREIALTLKIACVVYCSVTVSSMVLKPGFNIDAYRSESTSIDSAKSPESVDAGPFSRRVFWNVKRYGTRSDGVPCNVFNRFSRFLTVAS
jgi:hypothetical protein